MNQIALCTAIMIGPPIARTIVAGRRGPKEQAARLQGSLGRHTLQTDVIRAQSMTSQNQTSVSSTSRRAVSGSWFLLLSGLLHWVCLSLPAPWPAATPQDEPAQLVLRLALVPLRTMTPALAAPSAAAVVARALRTVSPIVPKSVAPKSVEPTALDATEQPSVDLSPAALRLAIDAAVQAQSLHEGTRLEALPPGLRPNAPASKKTALQQSLDQAVAPDCARAYAGLGLLAVLPLALDAVRDGGCRWK